MGHYCSVIAPMTAVPSKFESMFCFNASFCTFMIFLYNNFKLISAQSKPFVNFCKERFLCLLWSRRRVIIPLSCNNERGFKVYLFTLYSEFRVRFPVTSRPLRRLWLSLGRESKRKNLNFPPSWLPQEPDATGSFPTDNCQPDPRPNISA